MMMLFSLLFISFVISEPLLLTPLIEAGKYDEARSQSRVMYSGSKFMGYSAFITVPSASGKNWNNIYFWIQPKCEPTTAPFILWLQGGPGAPGTFGALGEIGRWWIDEDLSVKDREFSWCDTHNCIFLDQPVMTGYSYQVNATHQYDPKNIEYTKYSIDAMEQVYQLLLQVFKVWPEFKDAPFYITGESYGGRYTASMGWVIYQHNKQSEQKINFKGLAVGDPIINAEYQWPTYADTMYGYGVVMLDERERIREIMKNGVDAMKTSCIKAFNYWNSFWNDNQDPQGEFLFWQMTGSNNTENILLAVEPDQFSWPVTWMNQSSVRKEFHFDGTPSTSHWEGGDVYMTMVESGDFCMNSSWIFAQLFLYANIDLMIYSTTMDALLGPPTTEAGVAATWDYAEQYLGDAGKQAKADYKAAKKEIWKVKDEDKYPSGYQKCFLNDKVGGHETPAFIPRGSYDLINRFIYNREWTKKGDDPDLPTGPPCGGSPPFAGNALPACVC